MTQKTFIFISIALFAASALFLFWQNERELDPDQGKNWWVLSFAVPQESSNFAFVVENHSEQTHFSYTITINQKTRAQAAFTVARGDTVTITPEEIGDIVGRVGITVTDGQRTKEIYR